MQVLVGLSGCSVSLRRRGGGIFGIALVPCDEQVERAAKRRILFDEAFLEQRDLRFERGEMFGVDRRRHGRRRFGFRFEHIRGGGGRGQGNHLRRFGGHSERRRTIGGGLNRALRPFDPRFVRGRRSGKKIGRAHV